jgi:ferredoxin
MVMDPRIQFEWNDQLDAMVAACIECGACWEACPAGEEMLEKSIALLQLKKKRPINGT